MISTMFFIFVFLGASASAYMCSKSKKAIIQFGFLVISFLFLFIPSAIRYNVGTDYYGYINYFYSISRGFGWAWSNVEPFYVYSCYFIHRMGLGAQWSLAFFAFLTLFLVYCAIPRKYLYIAIPVYTLILYYNTFNQVRQAAVIGGAFLATRWLIEQKYVRAFLLVIIMSGFHTSSLFYVPVFLVFIFLKMKPKSLAILLFLISIPLSLTILSPTFLVENLMSYLYNIEGGTFSRHSYEREGGIGFYGRLLVYILIFFYIVIIDRKNKSNFDNIVLWGFLFILIGHFYAIQFKLFDRFLTALNYCLCLIGIYIYTTPNKYRKIFFYLLIATIGILLYLFPVAIRQSLVYRTIF